MLGSPNFRQLSRFAYRWEWDYFYKDHLGNIRTTVTEQRDTARYIGNAESSTLQTQLFFSNGTVGRRSQALVSGMPTNSDPNSTFVYRISGTSFIGSLFSCQKVMAGDSVDKKSEYWYLPDPTATTLTTSAAGYNIDAFNVLSVRSSFRYAATLSSHGASVAAAPPVGGLNFAVGALLQLATNNYTNPGNNPTPKCYLNWLLLDEQLNYVGGSGGIMQIGAANPNAWQLLVKNGLVMPKSGYFISYYTNETDVTVYLDNIVLSHRSGPLLQESDTYAFGGGIDALESRSFGRAENKYGYNGKEKQPDLGLEWLDYGARMYDAQVGRWHVVDPLADAFHSLSPYVYAYNNPIRFVDIDGMAPGDSVVKNEVNQITSRIESKFIPNKSPSGEDGPTGTDYVVETINHLVVNKVSIYDDKGRMTKQYNDIISTTTTTTTAINENGEVVSVNQNVHTESSNSDNYKEKSSSVSKSYNESNLLGDLKSVVDDVKKTKATTGYSPSQIKAAKEGQILNYVGLPDVIVGGVSLGAAAKIGATNITASTLLRVGGKAAWFVGAIAAVRQLTGDFSGKAHPIIHKW